MGDSLRYKPSLLDFYPASDEELSLHSLPLMFPGGLTICSAIGHQPPSTQSCYVSLPDSVDKKMLTMLRYWEEASEALTEKVALLSSVQQKQLQAPWPEGLRAEGYGSVGQYQCEQ